MSPSSQATESSQRSYLVTTNKRALSQSAVNVKRTQVSPLKAVKCQTRRRKKEICIVELRSSYERWRTFFSRESHGAFVYSAEFSAKQTISMQRYVIGTHAPHGAWLGGSAFAMHRDDSVPTIHSPETSTLCEPATDVRSMSLAPYIQLTLPRTCCR